MASCRVRSASVFATTSAEMWYDRLVLKVWAIAVSNSVAKPAIAIHQMCQIMAKPKTVLIPEENRKDLVEIPANIRDGLEIIPVSHVDEVLALALVARPEPIEWTEADDLASQPTAQVPPGIAPQTAH